MKKRLSVKRYLEKYSDEIIESLFIDKPNNFTPLMAYLTLSNKAIFDEKERKKPTIVRIVNTIISSRDFNKDECIAFAIVGISPSEINDFYQDIFESLKQLGIKNEIISGSNKITFRYKALINNYYVGFSTRGYDYDIIEDEYKILSKKGCNRFIIPSAESDAFLKFISLFNKINWMPIYKKDKLKETSVNVFDLIMNMRQKLH